MLKKRFRLVKRGSFSYVYKHGGRVKSNSIKLTYAKSKGLRIGFSVGTKIGKAVKRNLVRRRMIHACSHFINYMFSGYQIVFSCEQGAEKLTYEEIYSTMQELLIKAKIMQLDA